MDTLDNRCRIKICELLNSVLSGQSKSPLEAKKHLINKLKGIMGVKYVSLWRYNAGSNTLHLGAASKPELLSSAILDINTPAGDAVLRSDYICISNIQDEPRFRDKALIKDLDLRTMYAFPIIPNQETVEGVLCLYPEDELTKNEVREIYNIAQTLYLPVRLAIDRHRITLTENIHASLAAKKDRNSFIYKALEIVKTVISMDAITFFLWDSINEQFRHLKTLGAFGGGNSNAGDIYKKGDIYIDKLIGGNTVVLHSQEASEYFGNITFHEEGCNDYYSVVLTPIMDSLSNDNIVGFIRCVNERNRSKPEEPDYFSPVDEEMFCRCAEAMSVGLRYYRERDRINRIFSDFQHEAEVPVEGIESICEKLLHPNRFPHAHTKLERLLKDIENGAATLHDLMLQYGSHGIDKFTVSIEKKPINFVEDILHPCIVSQEIEIKNHKLPSRLADGKTRSIHFDPSEFQKLNEIFVDPVRTQQIFGNILRNAVKYHSMEKREEFEVLVCARNYKDGIVIFVCDNGMGIRHEIQDRIFELDYRAPEGRAASVHGLGLGLYLAKKYAETHKWELRLVQKGEYNNFDIPERFKTVFMVELSDSVFRSPV